MAAHKVPVLLFETNSHNVPARLILCRRVRPCRRGCQAQAAQEEASELQVPIAGPRPTSIRARCYGCGAPLQTTDTVAAGYVAPEVLQQKRQYRQLSQVLCGRCQELSNGAMVPGVVDLWRDPRLAPGRSSLATPEQLRQQLAVVRGTHAVVVLMVDLLDASGSFLSRVRDLIGKNPVVVVGTKADLLPKGTQLDAVAAWLQDTALHKRLNAVQCCLVSSRTRDGVAEAASAILRERRGRDVYILGAANVGKSAFIRALMQEMSIVTSLNFDPMAAARVRRLPVESAMPGTTLRLIPLKAFSSSSCLYDTPGVHLHHRLIHMLAPSELKAIHPWKKLRPYLPPPPRDLAAPSLEDASPPRGPSGTYFWGGLMRLDIVSAPPSTQLVFYGPSALHVTAEALRHSSGSTPSTEATPPQREHSSVAHLQARTASEAASQVSSVQTGDAGTCRPSIHDAGQTALQAVHPPAASSSEANFPDGAAHRHDSQQHSSQDSSTSAPAAPVELFQHASAGDRAAYSSQALQSTPSKAELQGPEAFGTGSVAARGGLVLAKQVTINAAGQGGPLADIAVSGLSGWAAVFAPGQRGAIEVRIWVPRGIEVYVRPPMPVGLVPG